MRASELASGDPTIKKAAVASLAALSDEEVRKLGVQRGLDVTKYKARSRMNVAIIAHEEYLVVGDDSEDDTVVASLASKSVAVTPEKGKVGG